MSTFTTDTEMGLWTPVEFERDRQTISLLQLQVSASLILLKPTKRGEIFLNTSWREWFIRRLTNMIGFPFDAIVMREGNGIRVSPGASRWPISDLVPLVEATAGYISQRQLRPSSLPFERYTNPDPDIAANSKKIEWLLWPKNLPVWHDSFQRLSGHIKKKIGQRGHFFLWTEAMQLQEPEGLPLYGNHPVTDLRSAGAIDRWGKTYSGAILLCRQAQWRTEFVELIEYELTQLFVVRK